MACKWIHTMLRFSFLMEKYGRLMQKAYRNPIALKTKICKENGFPQGEYSRGYIVIPNEYTINQRNYTTVINRALKDQKNVTCVTWRTLKSEISKKEAACHEQE